MLQLRLILSTLISIPASYLLYLFLFSLFHSKEKKIVQTLSILTGVIMAGFILTFFPYAEINLSNILLALPMLMVAATIAGLPKYLSEKWIKITPFIIFVILSASSLVEGDTFSSFYEYALLIPLPLLLVSLFYTHQKQPLKMVIRIILVLVFLGSFYMAFITTFTPDLPPAGVEFPLLIAILLSLIMLIVSLFRSYKNKTVMNLGITTLILTIATFITFTNNASIFLLFILILPIMMTVLAFISIKHSYDWKPVKIMKGITKIAIFMIPVVALLAPGHFEHEGYSNSNPFPDVRWAHDHPGATDWWQTWQPVLASNPEVELGPAAGGFYAELRFKDVDEDGIPEAFIHGYAPGGSIGDTITTVEVLKYQEGENGLPAFVYWEESEYWCKSSPCTKF